MANLVLAIMQNCTDSNGKLDTASKCLTHISSAGVGAFTVLTADNCGAMSCLDYTEAGDQVEQMFSQRKGSEL